MDVAVAEEQPSSLEEMNLPEEILTEILLKLPVKSLLRFSCVCRAWRTLIRSPYFGDEHLHHYCYENNHSTVFLRGPCKGGFNGYIDLLLIRPSRDELEDNSLDGNEPTKLEFPFMSDQYIYASCNGILCLSDPHSGVVHLCNPATREYLTLPTGLFPDEVYLLQSLGLGFDPSTNDYKVIRVSLANNQPKLISAEIYKLRTNCWSKHDVDMKSITPIDHFGVFKNGYYHWLAGFPQQMILTFDFQTEIFGRIELPDLDIHSSWTASLSILDGSLAFITENYSTSNAGEIFEVWMMMEYGNKESWTKKCSVGPFSPIRTVVTRWNDDKLFLLSSFGKLISCFLDGFKEIRIFDIDCCFLEVVVSQQTLVSLSGRNEELAGAASLIH